MNRRADHAEANAFSKRDIRTVLASCVIGTSIEWYDFFLYGMAAGLIFNKLYFPSDDPLLATIMAFASFAIGFVARPVGGLVFGHIGDRVGRKKTLVATMMIMGVATFLIGIIPTHAAIGVAAPIVLVLCRIAQGIAVGGEWGGAVLMAVEYASPGKRGLYGSIPQVGLAIGLVLGTGVFTLLGISMSDDAFLSWGWRIAFMLSAVLVGVGLFVRLKVMETPAFAKLEKAEAHAVIPAVELIRDRQSRRNTLLGMGSRWAEGVAFNLWAVFIISYATGTLGVDRETILTAVMIGAILMVGFIPLMGRVSDRFDRRRMYALGVLALGVVAYPAFLLIGTGITALIFLTVAVVLGIIYPIVYAPEASLFSELFPTRVRYTGISVVYQISGVVASGMTPLILAYLLREDDGGITAIIVYIVAVTIISAVSAMLIRTGDMHNSSDEETAPSSPTSQTHAAP